MSVYTLAVVDMAGTTIQENGAVERAARSAVRAVSGGDLPVGFDQIFSSKRGAAKIDMFRAIVGNELAGTALEYFEGELIGSIEAGLIRPIQGAEAALARLSDLGLRVALVTGFSPRLRGMLLEELGWQDHADLVLSPEDAGRGRPHPDLILTAMLRLEIGAVREVVVVGDTVNDLLAGTRAGSGIVSGVLTGAHTRRQLESAPHTHIVEDITSIPRLVAEAGD
jgi:phosphoglycolate phosphatase